jgi:hypothetical protein
MNRDCGLGYSVAADGKIKITFPRKTADDAIRSD